MANNEKNSSDSVGNVPDADSSPTDLNTSACTDVLLDQHQGEVQLTEQITIRAENSDQRVWAEIRVRTEWSEDGATFTWVAEQCRAAGNSQWDGYAYISCTSKSHTDYVRLGTVPQDSQWHSVSGRGSVSGNADFAKVGFKFECRMAIDGWVIITSEGQVSYRPAPVVISSKSETDEREFEIQGTKAARGASLVIYKRLNDVIGNGTNNGDGTWKARIRIPDGSDRVTLTAKQSVNGKFSDTSNSVTVVLKVDPVVIDSPKPNDFMTSTRPQVAGRGHRGAVITIYQHNIGNVTYGAGTVKPDGTWAFSLTRDLPQGAFLMVAGQLFDGETTWSSQVPITVNLKTPTITAPAANSILATTFPLSGTGAVAGATMQVFIDLTQTEVGKTTVSADAWSVPVTLDPGPRSLVALQTLNGVPSARSQPRAFKIRPAALTSVTTTPSDTSVKLSGTGYNGATVEIRIVRSPDPGSTAPAAVVVSNGRWETTAVNWTFGTYDLIAEQKVSDGAGGWITSLPFTFQFTRTLPVPTDIQYTPVYRPVFSGKGYSGATVVLQDPDGGTASPDALVANGLWRSDAAKEWGPTTARRVLVRQERTGQVSGWVELEVTIPAMPPTLNDPVEEGLSPRLSGTCWPGALLNVKFSDSTTVHPVSGSDGTWSLRRDLPFAPGVTHTVTVTQTAGGQTSPGVSKTFVVFAAVHKPVITEPAENTEVDRDVIVRGSDGMHGALMQLFDYRFGNPLGSKTLTADGLWEITPERQLEFRLYTVYARQSINGRESDDSERRNFTVVVLAPQFTSPVEGGRLTRTAMIEGTGKPGARVEVYLTGVAEPLLKDIEVDSRGVWKTEVTLPVGNKTIYARQSFEGQTSRDSTPRNYSVVPAPAVLETPAVGEHVGARTVASGFGVPGDTVSVRLGSVGGAKLGETVVQGDRTWSVALSIDAPARDIQLLVVASCDGFESDGSATRSVVLGTYRPVIATPAAGRPVDEPVRFAGQGRGGVMQVKSWFNPERVWAEVSVTGGQWQGVATQALAPGGRWCVIRQTITDDAGGATVSDDVPSPRFEVQPGAGPGKR